MVGSQFKFRKLFPVMAVFIAMTTVIPAHAAILFQDDSFQTSDSDSIQIGSNDGGASNTSIKFGADPTAFENGNITWNILSNSFSIDHTVNITGGISATGNANFSAASEFHIRQVTDEAAAACTTLKELVLDTTENKIYVCTAVGVPGTWTLSTIDFEGVYAADTGKDLNTSNGVFTVTTGTNSFVVDSNSWNVTAAGSLDAATVTSNGLLTGSAGSNISGGTINLNSSSNSATNINTGTSTGQVSVGGNSNCVKVDSNTWDISCAGVIGGLTGITSTGIIDFSSGTSFQIPQFASDPVTCNPGMQYFNTTTDTVRLCIATNTWTGNGPSGTQFFFAYDTTTQTVATANTFQDVTFDTNGQIDGWTHTVGSASFTADVAGTFMSNITARVAKSGGANTSVSMHVVKNGTEIPGTQSYGTATASTGDTMSGNFIFSVLAGDVIKLQFTGGTNNVQILPGGSGTTKPSIQFNVWRMK